MCDKDCGVCGAPCVRVTPDPKYHTVHRCAEHEQDEAHIAELSARFTPQRRRDAEAVCKVPYHFRRADGSIIHRDAPGTIWAAPELCPLNHRVTLPPAPTPNAEVLLRNAVTAGHIVPVAGDPGSYRLTPKGEQAALAMLRGDPEAKATFQRLMRGQPEPEAPSDHEHNGQVPDCAACAAKRENCRLSSFVPMLVAPAVCRNCTQPRAQHRRD